MPEIAGEVRVDITGNVAPFDASLEKVRQRAKQLDSQMGATKKAAEAWGTSTSSVSRAVRELERDTQQLSLAQRTIQAGITRTIGRLGALAAGYLSVRAAITAFKKGIDEIVSISRLSQQLGISTERLSELEVVAKSAGVSLEQLAKAGVHFASQVTNPTSQAAQAMRALGIETRNADGSFKGLDELLPAIADKFANAKDGIEKAKIATAIFGEELGARMIPLLNKGGAGLEALAIKGRRAGAAVTEAMVERALAAREASDDLSTSISALTRELSIMFAPAVAEGARKLADSFQLLNMNIKNASLNELRAGLEILERRASAMKQRMGEIGQPAWFEVGPIGKQGELNALMARYNDVAGSIAGVTAQIKILEEQAAAKPPGAPKGTLPSLGDQERTRILERVNRELAHEFELLGMNSTQQRVRNELFRIEEQFRDRGWKLSQRESEGISATIRANEALKQNLQTVNQAADAVFSSMASTLTEFAVTGKFAFHDLANSIIRDLFRIGLQAFAVKPLLDLTSSFAGGLLKGAAPSLPAWTTTVIPSFQHGGQFMMPGSGSGDRPTMLGLEPGELVSVSPRGQAGAPKVINNIQIVSSRDFKTEQRERTQADGSVLIDTIVTEVQKRMGGGGFDGLMEARWGVRPRTVRR